MGEPPGRPHTWIPTPPRGAVPPLGSDLGQRPPGAGSYQEGLRTGEPRFRPEPDPQLPAPPLPLGPRANARPHPGPGPGRRAPARRRRTLVSVERGRRRDRRALLSFLLSLRQPRLFHHPGRAPHHPPLPDCLWRRGGARVKRLARCIVVGNLKKLWFAGEEKGEEKDPGGAVPSEPFLRPRRAGNPPGTFALLSSVSLSPPRFPPLRS